MQSPGNEPHNGGLSVRLNLRGVPILIVGGGAVAQRRGRLLLDAGADTVIAVAPTFVTGFPETIAKVQGVFHVEHLQHIRLVFVATDDPAVNEHVGRVCAERGIWCNRSDRAAAGDVQVPLSWDQGPIHVAVSTGSPTLTQALARQVRAAVEPWMEPARVAGRLREKLQRDGLPSEARRAILVDVASDEGRRMLELAGEVGLHRWLAARHPRVAALLEIDG